MRLHQLHPAPGAFKKGKRVGRGRSSGHGKTSGRGQKGQLSRSGGGKGPGFEGGQTPLQRRLPKLPGFKNPFKKEYQIVKVEKLSLFKEGSLVGPKELLERGLIKKAKLPVKILGDGKLEKALTIKAHHFSKTALTKIKEIGGKAEVIKC